MNKQVLITKDYGKFKKLSGNRDVSGSRIDKIVNSINKVGYITSPIIVNEKMEVIDGQGRLEALKKLEMPVEYIVHPGIGIKECISMNVHQTNWRDIDYIKSHADNGNHSYQLLLNLIESFPEFGNNVFATALKNVTRFYSESLRNGSLIITNNEYNEALVKLRYLKRFVPYFKSVAGKTSILQHCIVFCYTMPEVDNEVLFEKLTTSISNMQAYDSILSCMKVIEDIYNKRNRKQEYVYIQTLYRIIAQRNESKNIFELNKKIAKNLDDSNDE